MGGQFIKCHKHLTTLVQFCLLLDQFSIFLMLGVNYYQALLTDSMDPKTPVEELKELAGSEFYKIRYGVALNPSATVEILERLSKDCWQVAYAVASNPTVTDEILRKLVQHENSIVRKKAVEHPNTSKITKRLYLMTITRVS